MSHISHHYHHRSIDLKNAYLGLFYALKQWIPASDYEVDDTRIPYEYYLDGENSVCVPVVPREELLEEQRKT